jgi:copper chaperone CopZ
MKCRGYFAAALVSLAVAAAGADDAGPVKRVKLGVTGLFSPDRVDDLKAAMELLPDIKLVSVDYKEAEATFEFDPVSVFPKTKPDDVVKQFDQKLRQATRSTFGVKPPRTTPADKLKEIEIGIGGLDCKGCALAAYEAVAKLEGVERATVSFKEGWVKAVIDPEKTDRAKLEDALTKKRVKVMPR